jgi:hypothetical protein
LVASKGITSAVRVIVDPTFNDSLGCETFMPVTTIGGGGSFWHEYTIIETRARKASFVMFLFIVLIMFYVLVFKLFCKMLVSILPQTPLNDFLKCYILKESLVNGY